MKKFIALSVLAVFMVGCTKDTQTQYGQGTVQLECEAQSSVIQTTKADTYELPTSVIPSHELFSLKLTGEYVDSETGQTESYSAQYESISNYQDSLPILSAGQYHAMVSYGDPSSEGTEAACFSGELDFEVVARKNSTETISASLSNSAIKITSTEWFDNYYTDAEFTITTSAGNSFTLVPNDDQIVFVAASSQITLEGRATKSQTGADIEFSGLVIGTTEARTISTIVVDASQAGGTSILVSFDQTLTEVDLGEIELNPNVDPDADTELDAEV